MGAGLAGSWLVTASWLVTGSWLVNGSCPVTPSWLVTRNRMMTLPRIRGQTTRRPQVQQRSRSRPVRQSPPPAGLVCVPCAPAAWEALERPPSSPAGLVWALRALAACEALEPAPGQRLIRSRLVARGWWVVRQGCAGRHGRLDRLRPTYESAATVASAGRSGRRLHRPFPVAERPRRDWLVPPWRH